MPREPGRTSRSSLLTAPADSPHERADFPLRATALVVQSQDFLNHIHRDSRFGHHEFLPTGEGIRPSGPWTRRSIPVLLHGFGVHNSPEQVFAIARGTPAANSNWISRRFPSAYMDFSCPEEPERALPEREDRAVWPRQGQTNRP